MPLVIIPTYNEKENIESMIRCVLQYDTQYHILIVDDNSPDGTAQLVKNLMGAHSERLFLLERKGKLGLGTAYIAGFKWALQKDYEYIFEMDCDFSHNPDDLDRLLAACKHPNVHTTVGSRYVNNLVNVVNWPMSRVLMSFFASKYVKIITGIPVFDTTAGFVCYHRSVLEFIDLDAIQFIGYAFQIEMKFTIWKSGFQIVEVPVVFQDREKGASKMSTKIFQEAVFGVIKMKTRSIMNPFDKNNDKEDTA